MTPCIIVAGHQRGVSLSRLDLIITVSKLTAASNFRVEVVTFISEKPVVYFRSIRCVPVDGGSRFLRNIGVSLPYDTLL